MGGTTRFVASAAMLLLLTLHAIVLVGATNTGVTNIQPTHATMPQAHPSSTADALNAVNSGGMMHYYMDAGGSLYVRPPHTTSSIRVPSTTYVHPLACSSTATFGRW
jgi:hypothetical protein